jgi:glutamyl-tRNA synthetase
MRTMDGDVEAAAEPRIESYDPDDVVQFERIGFVRIDAHDDGTVAYYAHR